MIKRRIQLRNIAGVGASKTALIELPIGPRYHQIILQHGYASGTNTIVAAATNLTDIRLKVNGRVQRAHSGTQLRDLNLLMGTAYDALVGGVPNTAPGVTFPIYLAEPWRKDARDQDALAWSSARWDSLQLEVDLSTASTPTLDAWAVVDDFIPEQPAGICKILRQNFGVGGQSSDISTIDRRDWLTQISLYPDSGGSNAATKVTLRKDGMILHEFSGNANRALLQNSGMSPAASGRTGNIYDLVLDHDDLLGSAVNLNGARDLTLTIEVATGSSMSAAVTALIQRIGPPE